MVEASLCLDNVSVDFPIYNAHGRSLKRSLLHFTTGGRIGLSAKDKVVVKALSDISVRLAHGDRVGLVGHNGAGKTTLMRVLAGVYEPTTGSITRSGRVGALFDLMLGMDAEATGDENITIRAMLMGLSQQEIDARRSEIADFTELGNYLDVPIRTYSSGMLLRLAFAISTSIDPDILLMDEWMAAGDASFLRKAEARLQKLIGETGILVLASHSTELLQKICNKGILMKQGKILEFGPIDQVIATYRSA
jgi:ABC-2 type transport system ATP-binding protein/lipopolysaccharide transport system ATP-binding protein